jgi:hypothetical protein
MPATVREDLSLPFLALGVGLAVLVAVEYLFYPGLFGVGVDMGPAYGGLLAAFALAYCYRPLRESRVGALVAALFVMLFAGVVYTQGMRGPLFPYGLFGVASLAFCYELYKLGTDRGRRGQVS